MPTETLPTRADDALAEKPGSGFAAALVLHLAVLAALGGWALVGQRQKARMGDQHPVAGSVQASMVNALPLPPRKAVDKSVLASEKPSEAPRQPPPEPVPSKSLATPTPPRAAPPPSPDAIPLAARPQPKTPVKPAERPQPETPKRPTAPPPPPTPRATTGETASLQIPAATSQLRNGTASITVEEHAFGDRYAYYIRLISQKVNESWLQQQVDAAGARGKHTTVTFTIDREGDPLDAHVTTPSGSGQLDQAALRTIQRIDTFGPLPPGYSNIAIAFSFDFHQQP